MEIPSREDMISRRQIIATSIAGLALETAGSWQIVQGDMLHGVAAVALATVAGVGMLWDVHRQGVEPSGVPSFVPDEWHG